MIIKKCDKCGKEIYYDPRQQAILPSYSILKLSSFLQSTCIDLCPECQKEFTKWIESKPQKEE